jgi:hypothetical protein
MTIVKSSGIPRPFNLTAEEAMELARAAVAEISKLEDMARNFVEGSTTEKQLQEKIAMLRRLGKQLQRFALKDFTEEPDA